MLLHVADQSDANDEARKREHADLAELGTNHAQLQQSTSKSACTWSERCCCRRRLCPPAVTHWAVVTVADLSNCARQSSWAGQDRTGQSRVDRLDIDCQGRAIGELEKKREKYERTLYAYVVI